MMTMTCYVKLFLLVFLFALSQARDAERNAITRKRTLVLVENIFTKDTHSTFFQILKDRNHDLTFKMADDASLSLVSYGELVYDNLILFAPSVQEFGGSIDVKALLAFIDKGGNILVSASSKVSEVIREFAAECGVEIDEENSAFIDHLNFDGERDVEGDHSSVIVDSDYLIKVPNLVGTSKKPLLYKGVAMSNDGDNSLLLTILHGSPSSYSYNPKSAISEYPTAVGIGSVLISAFQARNNARVAFVGSLSFFSDEYFSASTINGISGAKSDGTSNEVISRSLTKWLFQQAGVLRLVSVEHQRVDGIPDPNGNAQSNNNGYTIEDIIEYRAKIEEMVCDEESGVEKWVPFAAEDAMLEFVRIDPFIRTHLKYIPAKKELFLRFKLPDIYGVFKFIMDYNRIGYTHIHSSTQVSVRPLKHTQYERFIEMAFPYYVSAFSLMGALLCFSFLFVHFGTGDKLKVE